MYRNKLYYTLKTFVPRRVQIALRRQFFLRKRLACTASRPIDERLDDASSTLEVFVAETGVAV